MKVRMDDYDVRVLINGLYQQSRAYDEGTNDKIGDILFRLVDLLDTMKPGRRKKITFEPEEARLIRHCLIEWRNQEIQTEKQGAVDVINELLILFTH